MICSEFGAGVAADCAADCDGGVLLRICCATVRGCRVAMVQLHLGVARVCALATMEPTLVSV